MLVLLQESLQWVKKFAHLKFCELLGTLQQLTYFLGQSAADDL
nr:MAG TPA: hypothetical protein [Caudoviricetes sp.]